MATQPILIGVDLSEASYEAIRQGQDWARRRGTALLLCHVMPRGVGTGMLLRERLDAAIGKSVLEAHVADLVRARAAELLHRAPQEIEVIIDEGLPDAVLVRVANEHDAQLIVVGSHGHAGLDRIFLGDVAEAVARAAPRPVLVARAHAPTRRILVGTDFSRPARGALELAAEEARLRGARITLLTSLERHLRVVLAMAEFGSTAQFVERELADERRKAEERLAAELQQVGVEGNIIVTEQDPAADLVKTAVDLDADLIVVGNVGSGLFERLRLGRVAAKVTRHAPCSVLLVK